MRLRLLMAVFLLCAASAFGGSKNDGNGPQWGVYGTVAADVWKGHVTATGIAEYVAQEKKYVGDGSALRFRPEVRLYPFSPDAAWRPFVGAGVGFTQVWTSQYSKHAINPMITAGVSWRDQVVIRGAYLFPDRTPLPGEARGNDTSGFRIGYDYFHPITPAWSLHFSQEFTRYKFTQLPGYPNEGRHTAYAFNFRMGVVRKIQR